MHSSIFKTKRVTLNWQLSVMFRDYSPLQLGKIGEKIDKVFKFLSNTP